jgi:hypothetical protein
LIAKLEAYDCLQSLDAIVQAADGIMVARGDLGAQVKELCGSCVNESLCGRREGVQGAGRRCKGGCFCMWCGCLQSLDASVQAADGIMVARKDLGAQVG